VNTTHIEKTNEHFSWDIKTSLEHKPPDTAAIFSSFAPTVDCYRTCP
jgi:hypothetical protein